jgi:acyl-coenzyme A synthetase/AMP-(fatty) acid ligase
MKSLPLLPDFPADQMLACRHGRSLSRDAFLRDVLLLAGRLPARGQVVNLCLDRYWFAVGLFAAIARGLLSLLPNSATAEHLAAVCAAAQDLICLGDQPEPMRPQVPYLRVGEHAPQDGPAPQMPQIPAGRRTACVFTSGSTGTPVPHFKTFGRMLLANVGGAERLWALAGGRCAVLGTVPIRHMYGLDASVLLPIFGGGQISSRIPFFPADIAAALAELPAPRLLVTTPFHLAKLLDAGIDMPPVAAVLSATAPLSPALAARTEAQLGAPMMELYGSTETGQLAMRRPGHDASWHTLPGITLRHEGDATIATGGHLEGPQILNDSLELLGPAEFRLLDRKANMINIVGKRSSLALLNHIIANVPGVRDGAFWLPPGGSDGQAARLAAFVVAPGVTAGEIVAVLRRHLDPVFLPRPLVFVDALPRDGNGKITAAAMQALLAAHRGQVPLDTEEAP